MALTPVQRINALSPARKAAFRQWVAGVTAKPVAPTTGAGATFVLPGSAEANFGAQRANIGETYTEETAMNQFQLRNAQIARQREIRDQADAYDRAREDFAGDYIQRGIMQRGGVYGRDFGRFVQARQRQINDSRTDYTRQLAGLRLSREGIERRRALALANLEMKHQATLNDAATRSVR